MSDEDDRLPRPAESNRLSSLDAAAEWGALLQSGLADEDDLTSFKDWLSRSDSNRQAFRKLAQAWEDVGLSAMTWELAQEDCPLPAVRARSSRAPLTVRLRWFVPAAVAACAALMIGVISIAGVTTAFRYDEPAQVFHYATATGELRSFSLQDGSSVTLGGATTLTGRFTDDLREVNLVSGRAFFDVAADPDRPFRTVAAKTLITVVGTEFDVEYQPDDLQISVLQGRVAVSSAGSPQAADALHLTEGMRVRTSLAGDIGKLARFEPNSLSWREGQLAYVDSRLKDVISEVNRYRYDKITIESPDIEDLRVSFSIASAETDSLLAGLEATLPIKIVRTKTGMVIAPADPGE